MNLPPFLKTILQHDRDAALDEMRWRLHQRLLLLTSAVALVFGLRSLIRGLSPEMFVGSALTFAMWALVRRLDQASKPVVLAVLCYFVYAGTRSVYQTTQGFPTALLPLMVMPVFGSLLAGFLAGLAVTTAVLAVCLLALTKANGAGEILLVYISLFTSLALLLCCLAHAWILGSLLELKQRTSQGLGSTLEAAEGLAKTLGRSVHSRLQSLDQALESRAGLASGLVELEAELAQARRRLPAGLPEGVESLEALDQRLCAGTLNTFVLVALGLDLATLAAVLILHLLNAGIAIAVAAALLGLLALKRWSSLGWLIRARLLLLICVTGIAADLWFSLGTGMAGAMFFLPLLIFFAGLLDRLAVVLGLCLAALGLLAATAQAYPVFPGGSATLFSLGLMCLAMAGVNWGLRLERRRLLSAMGSAEAALRLSLNRYRRLASTLFHDLANPLAVLRNILSAGAAALDAESQARCRRMLERMHSISSAALRNDYAALPASGATVAVADLCGQLKDLFGERFQAKGVDCAFQAPEGMMLSSFSALMRDSVLANLVSNALKFSPSGSKVTLRAAEDPGGVRLRLVDQGPGFPPAALAALEAGLPPPSQPGTHGEKGSGFGLLLAKAYVEASGGKLSLRNLAGGGAEAEVWLPA